MADRCSNWLILGGSVLMVAGAGVFFSLVFAGSGVVIFLIGVGLCILGGAVALVSSLTHRLRSFHGESSQAPWGVTNAKRENLE